jgi:hypothetical protein
MASYMEEILRGQSHAELIGPIAEAGGENGLVLQGGEVVEEWGDTGRVDASSSSHHATSSSSPAGSTTRTW